MDRRKFISGIVVGLTSTHSAAVLVQLVKPEEIYLLEPRSEIGIVEAPPITHRHLRILGQKVFILNPDPVTRSLRPFIEIGIVSNVSNEVVDPEDDLTTPGTRVRFGGRIQTILDFEGQSYVQF
jgi:hypothetical protein